MKRIVLITTVCLVALFGLSATVFSADGAALFKRCVSCHGADGSKAPHVVKGQTSAALLEKMKGYASGTFGGPQKALMTNMVKSLSPEELQALADYMAKL